MDRRTLLKGAGALAIAAAADYALDGPVTSWLSKPKGNVEYLEYADSAIDPATVYKNFEDLVLAESENRFVILDFSADWCPHCKGLSPKLVPAAEDAGIDALVIKLRVQDRLGQNTNLGVINRLNQTGAFPEVQLYKDGVLLHYFSGNLNQADISNDFSVIGEVYRENGVDLTPDTPKNNDIEAQLQKGPSSPVPV